MKLYPSNCNNLIEGNDYYYLQVLPSFDFRNPFLNGGIEPIRIIRFRHYARPDLPPGLPGTKANFYLNMRLEPVVFVSPRNGKVYPIHTYLNHFFEDKYSFILFSNLIIRFFEADVGNPSDKMIRAREKAIKQFNRHMRRVDSSHQRLMKRMNLRESKGLFDSNYINARGMLK